MEPLTEDAIQEWRRELSGPGVGVGRKLEILERLVAAAPDQRLGPVLSEAAGCPANGPLLRHIARACGLLGDPGLLCDLARLTGHSSRSVVCSALRSAIALDKERGIGLAARVIRDGPGSVAFAAAFALARCCEAETREFFLGMTYSRRTRDRLAAMVYLRTRPPEESVPVVMEMVRREPDRDIRASLLDLLARRIEKGREQILLELKEELQSKISEIDGLLDRLPDELDPSWERPDWRPLSASPSRPADP